MEELGKKIDGRRGRPSKLTKKFVEKAYELAKMGATDAQIAQILDVDEATLNRYKAHPHFRESLNKCKEFIDQRVENSLLNRALGFSFDEEHQELREETAPNGEGKIQKMVTTRIVKKYIPPDVTAQIFWLKNRRRSTWTDDPEKQAGQITAITINHTVVNHNNEVHLHGSNGNSNGHSERGQIPAPDQVG